MLSAFSGDYYTQTKRESMTYIERLEQRRDSHGVVLSYGSVIYSETVLGYQRRRLQDSEVIDFQSLDLPTTEFRTRALWYELDELIDGLARRALPRRRAARLAARARARPDRGPAADRDV